VTVTADIIPLTQPHRCAACGSGDGAVHLVAVADPSGLVRNFHLHADCERAFLDKLPEMSGPRIRNAVLCAHCGKAGGNMQRATMFGAPDGGVPVHRDCLVAWFAKMDETVREPFPMREPFSIIDDGA
jgi:hypothetical protein